MPPSSNIQMDIFNIISSILSENMSQVVTEDTPLIGSESLLDSMKLVEVCLALEDRATDIGFDFDWTSDVAMSKSRSMFRTAGSIATEFINQMEAKM